MPLPRKILLTLLLSTLTFTPLQAAESPAGQWTGSYTCLQGETALNLMVSPVDGLHFRALFHFNALSSNPLVPEGCFTMKGVLDPSSGHLVFSPDDWILQPRYYVMVGLDGTMDAGGTAYSGTITGGYNCTSFQLSHALIDTSAPSPCNIIPGNSSNDAGAPTMQTALAQ